MTYAVISPIYDIVGEYGFCFFDRLQGEVIKLVGLGAVKENLFLLNEVDTIFFTAHGEPHRFLGGDLKPLIDLSNCHFLSNKVCFFPVCSIGKKLGEYIGQQGTFIGYNDTFDWFIGSGNPNNDYYASLFWNIQLNIAKDILQGKNLQEIYYNALQYYENTKKTKELDQDIIKTLEKDKNRFIVTGVKQPIKQDFTIKS